MSDEEVKVKIGGDTHEGEAAINEFAEHFEQVFDSLMSGSIKDLLGAVAELPAALLIAVGAIAELGEKVQEAVADTAKMVSSAIDLGERLGVSAAEAQALTSALAGVGVSSDTYASAAMRLGIQIKNNEANVRAMGVATRDSNGELLSTQEVMENAVNALRDYKEGTDRNLASMFLFGRGAAEAAQLLRYHADMSEEAKAKLAALGLTITDVSESKFTAYRTAMHEASETNEALINQVGQAFMPAMTSLSYWWGDVGPTAVRVLRVTLDGLLIVFDEIKLAMQQVYQVGKLTFEELGEGIGAVAAAMVAAAHGDFTGAVNILNDNWHQSGVIFDETMAKMRTDAEQASKDINDHLQDILNPSNLQGAPKDDKDKGKGKSFSGPPKKDTGELAAMQAELTQQLYDQQAYGEKAKQIEADFWRDKLEKATEGSATYKALLAKVYADENSDATKATQTYLKLDEEAAKAQEQTAVEAANFKAKMAAQAVKDHEITKAQELGIDIQAASEEYAAELAALQRKMALDDLDVVHKQQVANQIELLTQKYVDKQIEQSKHLASQNTGIFASMANSISSSLGHAFNQMATAGNKFVNTLKALWNSLMGAFINMVTKMVVEHAIGEATKTAVTEQSELERVAIHLWGSLETLAISAETSIKEIAMAAVRAIAAAWASISAIPYVGPFLAPAVAMATGAAIYGLASSISSASGGWMVPEDSLAMVHKDERVLPAKYSAGLDAMVNNAGDGGGGGGGGDHFHYHAGPNETPKSIFANQKAAEAMFKKARRSFGGR